MGHHYLEANQAGAVKQFIAPGANVVLPSLPAADYECYIVHPFGGPYVCQMDSQLDYDLNIEGSLRSPN
jgi:hypothetical protein